MSTAEHTPEPLSDDTMWRAVEARDASLDGRFWFAVRTTGIYCRPSCAARRALRHNVAFFSSPDAAENAGFRACRRCHPRDVSPDARAVAVVAAACRAIEAAEVPPTLAMLAAASGLSRHHFLRRFRDITGLTPKAYADGVRGARVRELLPAARSITEAAHDAGYNGNASFYTSAPEVLGMSPQAYRKGGVGLAIGYAFATCTLGDVLVAATGTGVCAILIGDDRDALLRDLRRRFARADIAEAGHDFADLVDAAISAIEMPQRAQHLPLDIRGTAFQHRVWQALRTIPCGETRSYGEVAQSIGAAGAVRAVASACAANPVAVVVPCHRVVGRDGALTGYRWGVERKRILLERERPSGDMSKDKPTRRR